MFVRILLPSIVLSACLSNPSVGATNTSAVGALATNWIGSFGNGLVSLPSQLLGGAVDVVTAPLERDLGIKHMPTGINGLSPRSPVLGGLDTLPLDAPYHTIVGGSLLEFAPYGRQIGINRSWPARFLCSSSDRQRVETHPSLEFGRGQRAAPEHDARKPAFGCWAQQQAARSLAFARPKSYRRGIHSALNSRQDTTQLEL